MSTSMSIHQCKTIEIRREVVPPDLLHYRPHSYITMKISITDISGYEHVLTLFSEDLSFDLPTVEAKEVTA